MKVRMLGSLTMLILAVGSMSVAQDRAAVQLEKPGTLHQGGPIAFTVKLNEPLPKGARFDFRISPISVDEEVELGSVDPVKGSDTEFRVSGKLPDGAVPGDWRIKVIWLFLPGAGWTQNQIVPNPLTFHIEGKPFPIPTRAEVALAP